MFGKKIASLVLLSSLFIGAVAETAWAAPKYPRRPITVVIPYVPGGWVELLSRPFLEAMGKELGVNMVINMTPGAGGAIGITKAAQAKPDGYTLLITSDSSFSFHPLVKNVRYTREDGNIIHGVVQAPAFLATSKKSTKIKDFDGFIAHAKANKGQVTFGISGGMSSIHYSIIKRLELAYGIEVQPVPFDGAIQVTNAIVSGHVDIGLTEYSQNSELNLMVLSTGRTELYPDVPSFADFGHPEIDTPYGMVLVAPKNLPEEYHSILAAAADKASRDPAFLEMCRTMLYLPSTANAAQSLETIDAQVAIVQDLIARGMLIPEKK